MIINETDKVLMALRPYQVYAVEALIKRATETNNNGYIWHTTGSGKTLTSFKTSQILSREPNINKVIFLVDRKDLDSQTLAEFNKFENDSVDLTDNTRKLLQQLDDPTQNLIVTTIQKMANAIKTGHKAIERYKEDKVVFIIDECHRTQFGDMHRVIKQHLRTRNTLDSQVHHVLKKMRVKTAERRRTYSGNASILTLLKMRFVMGMY